ncbi:MFS transporter [Apiospora saccharicola]
MKLSLAKPATAESCLPPAIIGVIALPVGMLAFAWTNYPNINRAVCIALSSPFGFGCVLVIFPVINYLIDTYTIYAASVLAAAAIFRSIMGAVFPLFTFHMYNHLGIHWATSIPAFLTLACMPFPFIMYRYGEAVRIKFGILGKWSYTQVIGHEMTQFRSRNLGAGLDIPAECMA